MVTLVLNCLVEQFALRKIVFSHLRKQPKTRICGYPPKQNLTLLAQRGEHLFRRGKARQLGVDVWMPERTVQNL